MQDKSVDRRTFLRRLVTAATGIAVVAAPGWILGAEARAKATKAKARYQDQPSQGQRCGGCKFFIFPSGCSVVTGTVAFDGWCKLFER